MLIAGDDDGGERLDRFLVRHFPDLSRSALARRIKDGQVRLERSTPTNVRPSLRMEPGDTVHVTLGPRVESYAVPEAIPLDLLYEDAHLLAVDKPAGLVVHPGSGARTGTLANALAHHFEQLSAVQGPLRPGIVHRLDKDTSGVMLVAKDDATHHALARQFREREVEKQYLAVVRGVPDLDQDLLTAPIGPHRRDPVKRAVRLDVGKAAETLYQVIERFPAHAYVRCLPRTGRTHQIRVHLASIHHPVVSDRHYGGHEERLQATCGRQALHAHAITFDHPSTGERLTLEAPLHADMAALLAHLRS